MTLQLLIETYGYAAILIGAFLEGETVLVLGGFAAHRGYLQLPGVIAVALAGGFAGDQLYFFLGRRYGSQILARFPSAQRRAARVDQWLRRFQAPLIIGIRFLYGFRIVGPIILGMGRVSAGKFVVFNFIGASLWALLVVGVGYVFGGALEIVLVDAKRYETWAFGAIMAIGAAAWAFDHFRVK